MQLLSLAAPGPEAQRLLDDLSRKLAHDYTGEIITFAAITLALWIAAAWIAAQAVVKDSAGIGNAIATGFRWFTGVLAGGALAGAAFYFARLRGSGTMATASIGIGAILLLYAAVNSPMKVYKIGFGKGLAFAVVGVLVHLAAQVAVQKAMGDPLMLTSRIDQVRRLAALSPEEASKVLTALKKPPAPPSVAVAAVTPTPVAPKPPRSTPSPAEPPKPSEKSIAERHGELKKVYADLMAQRESLREGDDAGLAAYNRDTARYVGQLAQLQRDYDASKPSVADSESASYKMGYIDGKSVGQEDARNKRQKMGDNTMREIAQKHSTPLPPPLSQSKYAEGWCIGYTVGFDTFTK